MRAVQVQRIGGPEVLETVEIPEPRPGPGEVLIEVTAAGLNFIDTYQRSGLYERPVPFVPGAEAAGTVVAVGDGVERPGVGETVVTVAARGAYAERTIAAARDALPVPSRLDGETAAAVALQGLTAHYLTRDSYPIGEGTRALVHAGAGGVGGLLLQIAALSGAETFTTVSGPEKAEVATAAGANHVIDYTRDDFATAVREIAGEKRPLDVVYDGVGRTTFHDGLGLLRPRGTMVLFGQSSGPVGPVDLQVLNHHGSLFATRPSLGHHMGDEGPGRAADLFGWIETGEVRVRIDSRYPLERAGDAHRALEGRRTMGKVLIVP